MQRWRGLHEVPADWGPSVVTIGVFDGVHRGHRSVIGRVVAVAAERGLPSVVITFDPHPSEVVRPGTHPPILTTQRYRAELLGRLGVDAVLVLPFTLELSRFSPEEFVDTVLCGALHAAVLVVGENFRFGHKAAGNVAVLREAGARHGFEVETDPIVGTQEQRFSSTETRRRVAAGDVAGAAEFLDRPHRVEGVVVRGEQRGRELGYPTANLETEKYTAIPGDGVYAGWLVVGSERLPAAISVGTKPTFGGTDRLVEAYALDRTDLDLYGRHVGVEFVAYLRGMEAFDSVESLLDQMADDVKRARELVDPASPEPSAVSGGSDRQG